MKFSTKIKKDCGLWNVKKRNSFGVNFPVKKTGKVLIFNLFSYWVYKMHTNCLMKCLYYFLQAQEPHLLFFWFVLLYLVCLAMGTKIKGVFKGFKFISQIFGKPPLSACYRNRINRVLFVHQDYEFWFGFFVIVMKERELEIGYPTDVKHVAHIGWDGSSGSAPSWVILSFHILIKSMIFSRKN